MIQGEKFTPVAYFIMLGLTIVDCFYHINQLFMVFAFTSLLVYIGSVKSSKIFSKEVQASEIETMKQEWIWNADTRSSTEMEFDEKIQLIIVKQ